MEPLHPRDLLKAMMFSALVTIGAITASYAIADVGPPVVAVTDSDGNRNCSAVVVAPGTAYTARHCTSAGMKVQQNGKLLDVPPATVSTSVVDAAVLHVPGLTCPCATPSDRLPAVGVEVTVVGFSDGGERQVKQAKVIHVGSPNDLPEYKDKRNFGLDYAHILYFPAVLATGDSGGGTFVKRADGWHLVAINTIGVPDPKTFNPMAAMYGVPQTEIASGSVPVSWHMGMQ